MSIQELLQQAHGNALMIPIPTLTDDDLRELGYTETLVDFEKLAQRLDVNIEQLYVVVNNLLYRYCYYNPATFVQVELNAIDHDYLTFMQVSERIHVQEQEVRQALAFKNSEKLFMLLDKRLLFSAYQRFYHDIPDDQKYNRFRDIYMRSEYDFQLFTDEWMQDIYTHATYSLAYAEAISKLAQETKGGGVITVYRGQGSQSTSLTDTYSWTLDKEVAKFFANRFDGDGKLYAAEVHTASIIDYIHERDEKEVLVHHSRLENIREVGE